MVEYQQEESHILTEGFEEGSPHFLVIRINNFLKQNGIHDIIDIKYSSFLKGKYL
jgi:hypothetical protein